MKMNVSILVVLLGFSLATSQAFAQSGAETRPSPPAEVKGTIFGAQVAVNYSSPAVKGRTIWGDLVPYGKIWRTGANEATVFETDKDIMINGEPLPAGKYSMFSIPGKDEWTFIFNSVWNQWGSYKYDAANDVLRVKATPKTSPVFHERMNFRIEDNALILSWENLSVLLEIK